MIIIYYCFGGTHSSVLSAAIHTGRLPLDRVPLAEEITNLPYFDQISGYRIGTPFYFGNDESGNSIYILGTGKARKMVLNALKSLMEIEGIPPEEIYLENTLKNINLVVRVGGFLSRGLGLVFPGRNLTVYGLQRAYFRFVRDVKRVKREIIVA